MYDYLEKNDNTYGVIGSFSQDKNSDFKDSTKHLLENFQAAYQMDAIADVTKILRLETTKESYKDLLLEDVTTTNLDDPYYALLPAKLDQLVENSAMEMLTESSVAALSPIVGITLPVLKKAYIEGHSKDIVMTEVPKKPIIKMAYERRFLKNAQGEKFYIPDIFSNEEYKTIINQGKGKPVSTAFYPTDSGKLPIQDFDILTYYFYDKNPTSEINSYTYDGTPKIPEVKFFEKNGTARELKEGKDYTLTCTNNVNAGTATATIKGMGIYAGTTVIKNYTISKADQDLLANITTTNLKCGETAQIVAIGEGNITYSSSDESVAQVSSKGVVKAVGEGYTVITINAAGNNNYNSDTERIIVFVSGTVNPTEPTTKPDQIIGDVNSDGSVTVLDATMLQKYIAGLVSLGNEQLALADTNGDGSVTVLDATAIQKYLAGLVTALG